MALNGRMVVNGERDRTVMKPCLVLRFCSYIFN